MVKVTPLAEVSPLSPFGARKTVAILRKGAGAATEVTSIVRLWSCFPKTKDSSFVPKQIEECGGQSWRKQVADRRGEILKHGAGEIRLSGTPMI